MAVDAGGYQKGEYSVGQRKTTTHDARSGIQTAHDRTDSGSLIPPSANRFCLWRREFYRRPRTFRRTSTQPSSYSGSASPGGRRDRWLRYAERRSNCISTTSKQ